MLTKILSPDSPGSRSFSQGAPAFGLPCSSLHFPISAGVLLSQFSWIPSSISPIPHGCLSRSSPPPSPGVSYHPGLFPARTWLARCSQNPLPLMSPSVIPILRSLHTPLFRFPLTHIVFRLESKLSPLIQDPTTISPQPSH